MYGIEGKVSWRDTIGTLPAERTEDWMRAKGIASIVNHQHPDSERA